jgi:TonB family protein
MPPIAKESAVIAATPGTTKTNPPATSTHSETPAGRPQPVALEVPVTVNGARTVEGTDKREPFSETTKTVLVLSNGAVIRLASTVAPGQLLFLTNEKTKKEVVCQVVKSKNYRNVSGYVELEFTEPVLGFWGMRFPSDRIAPAPVAPPPVPVVSPLATVPPPPKAAAPAATRIPETVQALPMVSQLAAPRVSDVKPAEPKPVEVTVKPPAIPVPVAPLAARPEIPVIPVPPVPVVPAAAMPLPLQKQTVTPADPVPASSSSEALKIETARLQEQLSSMLFAGAPAENAPQPQSFNPPVEKKETWDTAARIFESAPADNAVLKPALPERAILPAPSLEEENVKIPAWLEPLARNTIAPTSTQELLEREKARRAVEKPEISEPVIDPLTVAEAADVPELRVPSFGDELIFDEKSSEKKVPRGSNKGVWIGAIAAGLILAAGGGAWYLRQQDGSLKSSLTSAAAPAATVAASVLQSKPQPVTPAQSIPVNNLGAVPPPATLASTAVKSQISTPRDASASSGAANAGVVPKSTQSLPVQQQTHVVQEQAHVVLQQQDEPQLVQKKPGLGEVHLASPKFNRGAVSQDNGAADLGLALNGEQPAGAGASMGGELVVGTVKQPAAPVEPLPVGGDVRPAKLLSSVPPVYSSLARTQHVTGDVKIDALIDANGRVTSTKVISGPTLLHQAAIDALRQWKYQPATLDGKPVPMHLAITLQFRLQ